MSTLGSAEAFRQGPITPYGARPRPDGLQTACNNGRLPQTL